MRTLSMPREIAWENIYKPLKKSFSIPLIPPSEIRFGRITAVNATVVNGYLPGVMLGELCVIKPLNVNAEVIAIHGTTATLSPFSTPTGLAINNLIQPLGHTHQILLGEYLLGSVIDGLGHVLRGTSPTANCERRSLDHSAPNPLSRKPIDTPLAFGVRALDGLLTCGIGQRMGIFAAAGGGKSTLLSMICDGTQADIIVLALIGERGREVREFLEKSLTPQALTRTVVIVATSDRPAIELLKAA